eukprot:jgi/Mesen1/3548/ME000199S02703
MPGSAASMGLVTGSSPCAACKLLRRRCAKECLFAPYFPNDEPNRFANVHRVFGASNVAKMLQDLPEYQRSDAASSLAYEADARVRDPIYGCVAAISALQQQVGTLQNQLAMAQQEVMRLRTLQTPPMVPTPHSQADFFEPMYYKQQPLPQLLDSYS